MNAIAAPARPFEPTLRYSIASLVAAIFTVGARCLPRVFAGRATVVEREVVRQFLSFLSGTVLSSTLTTFTYGLATAYAVLGNLPGPAVFDTLVLPQLGAAFVQYVIPFAVANLVVLKGVVGMTSDIASMRVSQEVDALEAVGLHPAQMVFAPRALALLAVAPALAVLGVYSACLGAWIVSWVATGSAFAGFVSEFASGITPRAMALTVMNLVITAFATSVISGYCGFRGAKAEQGFIGRITTSAVANAAFSITIVNLFMSVLTAAFRPA